MSGWEQLDPELPMVLPFILIYFQIFMFMSKVATVLDCFSENHHQFWIRNPGPRFITLRRIGFFFIASIHLFSNSIGSSLIPSSLPTCLWMWFRVDLCPLNTKEVVGSKIYCFNNLEMIHVDMFTIRYFHDKRWTVAVRAFETARKVLVLIQDSWEGRDERRRTRRPDVEGNNRTSLHVKTQQALPPFFPSLYQLIDTSFASDRSITNNCPHRSNITNCLVVQPNSIP